MVSLPVAAAPQSDAPVDFSADSLLYDEQSRIVTARGNVELEQSGRILKADEVIYHVASDRVKARGNVVLMDQNGDVHFADTLELTDQMRDGTVSHLRSTLADGSRVWASEGKREAANTTTMKDAGYTPCEPCKANPGADPVWAIQAGEVRHEKDSQSMVYKNATFEVGGVPVFYMPYFSHPDGSVKQKSGFLTPSFGYASDLGFVVSNSYYMALSPHYDATLGLSLMTDQNPLMTGEYRHRFKNAELEISGGITKSGRTDRVSGEDIKQDDEIRGHVFADGRWDINNKWRSGIQVEYASDDQYMRQYDFSNKDVLENEIYIERFSGRDYAVGRFLAFQDVRIEEDRTDQPDVLPEIHAGFLGEPGETLGGRWSFDFSTLGLRREAGGQDLNRAIVEAGWQRRLVSDTGLLTTVDLSLRGDAYNVRDRDVATPGSGRSSDGTKTRGFAQANVETSYPVVKQMEKAQVVIEPIASVTLAPDINSEAGNFPNEDSQDVQLDASNLFEADRFPGMDRIEDQSHTTYGIRTGVYGHEGSKGEIFLGQSYRFEDDDNPFPAGSGLSDQESDIVGQVTAAYKDRFTLDYRFQLDNEKLSSRRHEVDASARAGPVQVAARYLYAGAIEGTDLNEDREQIQAGISYQVSEEWRVRSTALHDLGDDPGLRKATFGVDYMGQCYNVSGTIQRNLTRDSSGESNTEIMFRVGLKNLGEFETSGINLTSSGSGSDDNSEEAGEDLVE